MCRSLLTPLIIDLPASPQLQNVHTYCEWAAQTMDRYGELVAFTRAVTEGGFSATAFSLSLTPSAVSKLVSRLEDRLGVRLFSRSSRQVALTAEGETFYAAALRAIEAVEEASLAVAPGNLLGETLRIRSAPTFAARTAGDKWHLMWTASGRNTCRTFLTGTAAV